MQQLSLLLEVRPARRSASPGNAAGCLTREAAIGNSMAVPVMRWIGERIQQVEEAA